MTRISLYLIPKALCFVLFVISTTSCVSTRKVRPDIKIPAFLFEHFSDCSRGQETSLFRLSRGAGSLTLSGEIDWLIEGQESWDGEFIDGLGHAASEIAVRPNGIKLSGILGDYSASISVDSSSKIYYSGFFTGLLVEELSCMLLAELPKQWKDRITKLEIFPEELRISYTYKDREITSLVKTNAKNNNISICSSIQWSSLLGLKKNSFQWCFVRDEKGKVETTLSHPSDTILYLSTQK